MFTARSPWFLIAVSALAVGAHAGEAAAAPPDTSVHDDASTPPAQGPLAQEYAGFEASPLGLAFGGASAGGPSRFQPGGGAMLRFGRHRWRYGYLTPAQGGLFLGTDTLLIHAQVEAGLVLPQPLNRLEVGLGAGIGILGITYTTTGCDGPCKIGGVGPLFSPVARYLFIDGPGMSVGASVRAVVPVEIARGNWSGYFTGKGQLVLVAIDMAVGPGR